jgi:hypothetical protein
VSDLCKDDKTLLTTQTTDQGHLDYMIWSQPVLFFMHSVVGLTNIRYKEVGTRALKRQSASALAPFLSLYKYFIVLFIF